MRRRVQFSAPKNLDDAFTVISALGAGAALIAGGQELMPSLNLGEFEPSVLIDISGLEELRGIDVTEEQVLSIGALTVHRDVERSALVAQKAPLLAHAAAQIGGGLQVRNRGTIGGNIVSMHPLYDVLPPLLALQAQLEIRCVEKTYISPLEEVIVDTRHGLGSSALLMRVLIDTRRAWHAWGYCKLKATTGDYATATAAALVSNGPSGRPEVVRLVVGSVEALPKDLSEISEKIVTSCEGEEMHDRIRKAVEAEITMPLDDQKGGAEYRRAMAGVVATRALSQALRRAARKVEINT